MSEQVGDFAWATLWVIAGSVILTNAEALAKFDLASNDKMRVWLKRRLGEDSVWNRKIFPVRATNRFRNSKIGFRIVGGVCLLAGFAGLSLALLSYLH